MDGKPMTSDVQLEIWSAAVVIGEKNFFKMQC